MTTPDQIYEAELLARDARKLKENTAFHRFVERIEKLRDQSRLDILKNKDTASHDAYETLRKIVGDPAMDSAWHGFIDDIDKWAIDPRSTSVLPEEGMSDTVEE